MLYEVITDPQACRFAHAGSLYAKPPAVPLARTGHRATAPRPKRPGCLSIWYNLYVLPRITSYNVCYTKLLRRNLIHPGYSEQLTFPNKSYPITEPLYLRQNMRREEYGHSFFIQFAQEVEEFMLNEWIQTRCRLIEYGQLRPMLKTLHNPQLLAVPKRVISYNFV